MLDSASDVEGESLSVNNAHCKGELPLSWSVNAVVGRLRMTSWLVRPERRLLAR